MTSLGIGNVARSTDTMHTWNVPRAVSNQRGNFDFYTELRTRPQTYDRGIVSELSVALNAKATWCFEVHKQHFHLRREGDVAHRKEHAVSVEARKQQSLVIGHVHKAWCTAFKAQGGGTLRVHTEESQKNSDNATKSRSGGDKVSLTITWSLAAAKTSVSKALLQFKRSSRVAAYRNRGLAF